MAHFNFRSTDYFVEKTPDGVRVNHVDYTLDGKKVMDDDLHIFTLDFDTNTIERGLDYFVWETGVVDFNEWSQRLNKSPDEWDREDNAFTFFTRIDGKTYKIDDAHRAWPHPRVYHGFTQVGRILTEVDSETGATVRKVRWDTE